MEMEYFSTQFLMLAEKIFWRVASHIITCNFCLIKEPGLIFKIFSKLSKILISKESSHFSQIHTKCFSLNIFHLGDISENVTNYGNHK